MNAAVRKRRGNCSKVVYKDEAVEIREWWAEPAKAPEVKRTVVAGSIGAARRWSSRIYRIVERLQ
jgi:hypothetical protein